MAVITTAHRSVNIALTFCMILGVTTSSCVYDEIMG
jgi:hypothetical protein